MRHFCFYYACSWQQEQAKNGVRGAPLLSRFQRHNLLRGAVGTGSGVTGRGPWSSAISPRPSCRPTSPEPPLRPDPASVRSNHIQKKTDEKVWRLSPGHPAQNSKQLSRTLAFLPAVRTQLTWWTDYVFKLSMNMKHWCRFNSALHSQSLHPIVAHIWGQLPRLRLWKYYDWFLKESR